VVSEEVAEPDSVADVRRLIICGRSRPDGGSSNGEHGRREGVGVAVGMVLLGSLVSESDNSSTPPAAQQLKLRSHVIPTLVIMIRINSVIMHCPTMSYPKDHAEKRLGPDARSLHRA
jgi:hypothetical protein